MMQEVKMRERVDLGSEALYFISEDEIEESEEVSLEWITARMEE